jgi:hypothetical protein
MMGECCLLQGALLDLLFTIVMQSASYSSHTASQARASSIAVTKNKSDWQHNISE